MVERSGREERRWRERMAAVKDSRWRGRVSRRRTLEVKERRVRALGRFSRGAISEQWQRQ